MYTGITSFGLMQKIQKPVCTTCGTQFPDEVPLPDLCPICNDDRQYIKASGQNWIALDELSNGHTVKITRITEHLYSLKMVPDFAIGQRAFLVISPGGNILWDCIPLLDEAAAAFIQSKGGLKAIIISHPHYYSSMNEWAMHFDCPVYIHEADAVWVFNKRDHIKLWNGDEQSLWDGIRVVNTAGHFPGSCVLEVPSLSPEGALLSGDSLFVGPGKRHIAVMHSYPNQIMLKKTEFLNVLDKTGSLVFDTIYGAFEGQNLIGNAKQVFVESMQRNSQSYDC